MAIIGDCFQSLHHWAENFSLGPFNEILRPEVIKQALVDANVVEKRKRKLPSVLVVWQLIGMGLYRTLSIENVLRKVGNGPGSKAVYFG